MRTKRTNSDTPPHHPDRSSASSEKQSYHQAPSPATKMQSPAQAPPLSDSETARLRDSLDRGNAFRIITHPLSKKRKRGSDTFLTEDDLLDSRLSVQYEIRPAIWHRVKRYKKFSVGSESIGLGECILVKHEKSVETVSGEGEEPQVDWASQWKARVLEVRALDPEHVYLRVAWLNRPEDLPEGRQPYHGANELIPTNQLDIIDAMAVNGPFNAMWWKEKDDKAEMPGKEEFFWRQTYDLVNTDSTDAFSKLRRLCIDDAPQNPDEMIVQCKNRNCTKWLHVSCIAEDALERALSDLDGDEIKAMAKRKSIAGSGKKRGRGRDATTAADGVGGEVTAAAMRTKGGVKVEVFVKKDTSSQVVGAHIIPESGADKTEIVVTAENGERREPVRCLFEGCGVVID